MDLFTACIENGKTARRLYKGNQSHVKKLTIILEAVVSHDLWIWHAFFGMSGSHNDINVLQQSPLFARPTKGKAPSCHYTVTGHEYNMSYYLVDVVDGIYPP